ncbi:MAG: hypothetical protein Q9M50_13620 [Methylococcales bacterium]|nr:hypothetical protein [Methylococcales bacterium]
MIEVASLRYGVIFEKAFSNVAVFTQFVHDTLGLHLEIDHVGTKKTFDIQAGKVQPRIDLYGEDKKNRVIVNIQHENHSDHYERFMYYHGIELLAKIQKSTNYHLNLSVYTIVVLTSSDKYKKDVLVTHFDPCDLSGHYIKAIAHKIVFLCPRYTNAKTPKPLNQWLEVIEDSLDGQIDETRYPLPEIQTLISTIDQENISAEEETQLIDEYHLEKLKQTQRAENLKLGEEQGIQKGKLAEKLSMAMSMLQEDFEITIITKITGLTPAVILKLKRTL